MDKYLVIKKTKHKIKMETLCQFIFLVYIWSFSIWSQIRLRLSSHYSQL